MDCVIRVIQGVDKGLVHAVAPGPHVIGRGNKAAIRLTPEEISWEHAVLTREGEEYFVENLSALGTWVGDAKITGKVRLRPRDKVRLSGDCVVRLESAGSGGMLSSRAWLAGALVLMVGLAVAVVFYSNESGGDGGHNWEAAYRVLVPWFEQQAARHHVAPEAVQLFRRAWRLEQSKDYEHSIGEWVRLQIILAGAESDLHCLELDAAHPSALKEMLRPQPGQTASDDEQAAAVVQFVRRRLAIATKYAGGGILKNL